MAQPVLTTIMVTPAVVSLVTKGRIASKVKLGRSLVIFCFVCLIFFSYSGIKLKLPKFDIERDVSGNIYTTDKLSRDSWPIRQFSLPGKAANHNLDIDFTKNPRCLRIWDCISG